MGKKLADKNINEERLILKKVCLFNNSLKCHPLSAYNLAVTSFNDRFNSANTGYDPNKGFNDFVEKVCVKCPTYLYIKDKGIPK